MTDASTIIIGIIGGLSTGGVLGTIILYILKHKADRTELTLSRQVVERDLANYHAEANVSRKELYDLVMNDRTESNRNHQENKQAVNRNTELIESHYRQNEKGHKIIRDGLVALVKKVHGIPNGEDPTVLIKKLNGD